ncbi:hypothetical protein A2364_03350 [candidate division WWE3 bacterium RIFOXYB1_FULL_43_12]|nr:MAG: hypothetical protein A2364_03350 [candidate division WWE3 bacterium RIFOXYB1_FULL_43_12]
MKAGTLIQGSLTAIQAECMQSAVRPEMKLSAEGDQTAWLPLQVYSLPVGPLRWQEVLPEQPDR